MVVGSCPESLPSSRGSAQLQGLSISEGLLSPAQCPGQAGDTARVTELQPEVAVLCASCFVLILPAEQGPVLQGGPGSPKCPEPPLFSKDWTREWLCSVPSRGSSSCLPPPLQEH